jgi:translation initiation factor 2 subunit 1
MSVPGRDEWPEVGELVVSSADRITNHGAYVTLDEYQKEGFLHISEIASSWVRNIRDFVHEGEKVVLKVLRVDPRRGQVDLSLRRVTKRERREKLLLWKRGKKVDSLLRSASERLGTPLAEIHEKAVGPLEEEFGEVYEGLERAARDGVEVLLKLGLPKELAEVLAEIAKEKIKISMVKVKGSLNISCTKPDGVHRIREALLKARGVKVPRGTDIKIYVVSPPKYRIEVMARDYKGANSAMKKATETAVNNIAKAGGQGVFERG